MSHSRLRSRSRLRASAAYNALFSVDLQSTLVPEAATGLATPTFTRATTANVLDWEAVLRSVLSGEARFVGARRVRNLIPASENSSVWTKNSNGTGSVAVVTTGQTAPDNSASAFRIQLALNGGTAGADQSNVGFTAPSLTAANSYRMSVWIRSNTASTYEVLLDHSLSAFSGGITVTPTWQRLTILVTGTATAMQIALRGSVVASGCSDSADVLIWRPQEEDVTGQSNTNPSEYVSTGVLSAPYQGAGVDGVQYFTTKNTQTVASNVVTDGGIGLPINLANGGDTRVCDANGPFGELGEGQRTNLALWCCDLTNAAWTATNVTTAKTATGVDGVANGATTLTASAGNGTVLQSITSAANTRVTGCYIKRRTGTGVINMTQDNGGTWTAVTVTAAWTAVSVPSANIVNPIIGFQIVTSANAVDVQYVLHEVAGFNGTPIQSTTVAVTRNLDNRTSVVSGNLPTNDATIVLDWIPEAASQGTVYLWGSYVDASNSTAILHDGTNIVFRKRIAGVNTDATKALAYVAGTVYRIAVRASSVSGQDVFVAGVIGTNNVTVTAMQLGTNMQWGADGNSASPQFGSLRRAKIYGSALTDAQVGAL